MKFVINSYKGAEPLEFGMSHAEVREAVGGKFKSFKRDPDDEDDPPLDYFEKKGCFAYYSKTGELRAIEFCKPAEPMLDGVNLLGLKFVELMKLMKKKDATMKDTGAGFKSIKLGIGAWAPGGKHEPNIPAETVIVFREGYYEETDG
ncbi:hypothetical protein [Luteolibacter soli]|uniref:Uncharacterized protein n=1 Tax=Luteolibacter soli TaxID=3135280 RepID=A0ABU9AVE7_9BACT